MKIKTLLFTGLTGLALAGAAQAQTTYIEITGATAFRSAAVTAINSAFNAGGNFAYAFANTSAAGNTTSLTNGSMQAWKGTFPGIAGTTIIRTSWNGSVEGVRAVAVPNATNNPLYLLESNIPGTLAAGGGTPATRRFHSDPGGPGAAVNATFYEQVESDMSFSDVAQSATPVSGLALTGGPVGVVVFSMIASKTWKDDSAGDTSGLTNITAQQFRSMAQLGSVPLSFFSGTSVHTNRVYLTGRNDGSGTRTSYLAETGVGAAKPIVQYVAHDRSSTTNIPIILKTAAGGAFNFQDVATPQYASTVWGLDQDGNGGHVSSGDVRDDLSKNTTSTAVWEFVDTDESGTYEAGEDSQVTAAAKLYMISWVTYNDARSARGTGLASAATAQVLGYEGVILSGLAGDSPPSNISAADRALVANGRYTAWNFQQLYYVASRAGAAAVFSELETRLDNASLIGSAGMPIGEMLVNRTVDGGVILPGAP